MTEFIQVSTTTDKREYADKISREIVEKRLAACVQITGPVTSMYWWKDNIEKTEEWLLIIKTRKELYPELEAAIKKAHSYETPEIIAVPVVAGSKSYLDWLETETSG
jgi:periplasmic divalent cation tolerance protein